MALDPLAVMGATVRHMPAVPHHGAPIAIIIVGATPQALGNTRVEPRGKRRVAAATRRVWVDDQHVASDSPNKFSAASNARKPRSANHRAGAEGMSRWLCRLTQVSGEILLLEASDNGTVEIKLQMVRRSYCRCSYTENITDAGRRAYVAVRRGDWPRVAHRRLNFAARAAPARRRSWFV